MIRFLLLMLVLPASLVGQKSDTYELFFISIGSSHYINNSVSDTIEDERTIFRNIRGANKSARLFSDFLIQKKAKGVCITSRENQLVSRQKIFSSVDSLKKSYSPEKSRNPFLIFYYCGHGISEVASNLRFLMPGDFKGDISKMHVNEKMAGAVCLNDLYEDLSKLKVPFLIVLDCCADKEMEYYEGLSAVVTGTALNNIEDALDLMRAWFDLDGKYPVVCSSMIGESSYTVPEPGVSVSGINIGPMCRRILLANAHTGSTSLSSFIKKLTGLKDNETKAPTLLCEQEISTFKRNLW